MPRKYKRKAGVQPRVITWTEDTLAVAIAEMQDKRLSVNDIARRHRIPSRTLRRRFATQNKKIIPLGKHPTLGYENERRLVAHIQKLERSGFPPDQKTVRALAYGFAEKLKIKHNFNTETKLAGTDWFQSFLERNPILSIRQAEGLSDSRALALNREEINGFYELLTKVLEENDLLDKPDRIFNMDETGVQMNNKVGKVLSKGTRSVHSITSNEKGETLTVVACCNAVGNFLPPVVIIKGVHKKDEYIDGLPPGSKVFMNKKSAYINAELFLKWLREHFIPMKPQGQVLLILDGQSSHSSAVDMLEIARDNDIILLYLPSHTNATLQPLVTAVFKPFKTFFTAETKLHMRINPQKKINRQQSGKLIGRAWNRATTPANAIAGFRDSGIYPLNYNSIPENEFLTENNADTTNKNQTEISSTSNKTPDIRDCNSPCIIDDYNLGMESQPGTSLQRSATGLMEPFAMAEIEVRRGIWDMSSIEYSNKEVKRQQWVEMTNIFGGENLGNKKRTELRVTLQKKWKNIRDSFQRELRRIKGVSSSAAQRKSAYMYFNQLMFLIPMMENNAPNSSITEEPQSETNDSDAYIFATQEEPQSVRSKIKSDPKCDDDGVQTLIAILKDNINAIEAQKEMDSDQMFLMSLKDSFKNIPAAANMRAKIELMQTIDRYQPNRLQTEFFSPNNYIDAEKEEGVQHTAILCKNCQNIIVGFRYKCITCEDYYLCKNCEMMEMHSEHYVLRIPKPLKCKEAAKIAQKLQKIFIPDEDIPPIKVKEEDPIGVSIGECGDDELIQDDNVDDDIHSSEQFKNITYSEVSDVIDKSKDLGEPTGTVRRKKRRTAERETVRDGKRMRDADAKMNPAPEIAFADSNSDSYIEVEIKQETNEESEMISRLEVGETVNPYVKENQL